MKYKRNLSKITFLILIFLCTNSSPVFAEFRLLSKRILPFINFCKSKSYDPPKKTNWKPEGPRSLPYIGGADDIAGGDVIGNPLGYAKTVHCDPNNSDEVVIVAPPVFQAGWIAEVDEGACPSPTFDKSGNIYFSPYRVGTENLLVSLNPNDGSRRWVVKITGDYTQGNKTGGITPLVLDDPDNPGEQIVYAGTIERVVAVKTNADINWDGVITTSEMVWDSNTGIQGNPNGEDHITGFNYDPTTDTVVGIATSNKAIVLDRLTGESMLSTPFYSLPDVAPSPSKSPDGFPDFIMKRLETHAQALYGRSSVDLVNYLLGNNIIVANYFSIDPHTGKFWLGATAPDGDDGVIDGVSELGALYSLKLIPNELGKYNFEILNYSTFEGGSASTAALRPDGKRVYIGDNEGNLIAIDAETGSQVWKFYLGEQITASVSVAADNNELYPTTRFSIFKIIDHGTYATQSWRAKFDMYPKIPGTTPVHLLTAAICANGIAFQTGNAIKVANKIELPIYTGVGLLDRMTGEIRYYVPGREESVSVTLLGPDGAIYIGHSPIRRMLTAAVLGKAIMPPIGGIQKFVPKRLDLLIRDAVHAATDRAKNVVVNGENWTEDEKAIEVKQIGILIEQCKKSSIKAISDQDLKAFRWRIINRHLIKVESALSLKIPDFTTAYKSLKKADNILK